MKHINAMLAISALGSSSALGTITYNTVGPIDIDEFDLGGGRFGYTIKQLNNTSISVQFKGTSSSDEIAFINVLSRTDGFGTDSIVLLSFSEDDGSETTLGSVGRITVQDPTDTHVATTVVRFSGDLGDSAGGDTWDLASLPFIDIGGNLYADLIIDDRVNGTSTFTTEITVGGSWLDGDLYKNTGNINVVRAVGSISGTSSDPIEIWSSGSINRVEAASMSEVRIGSQTAGYSGNTEIGKITTFTGDFTSSFAMTIDELTDMDIAGDFDADITLLSAMPAAGDWRIGDTFASTAIISLPSLGLDGLFQINTENVGGQFLGDVEVGSITLAPNYEDLSSDIGDGAVGAAPYNFHQFEGPLSSGDVRNCFPHHIEQIFVGSCEDVTSLDDVIIDHYGPIFVNGTGPHFRVEYRPDFLPGGWTDVTSMFEVDTTKTDTANGGVERRAFLKAAAGNANAFNSAGRFRFRPLAGKVKSANVDGTPDVAYDSSVVSGDLGATTGTQYDWYQFRVRLSLCRSGSATFEGEQVNSTDITEWLIEPFEVNSDGATDTQDYVDMSNNYNP